MMSRRCLNGGTAPAGRTQQACVRTTRVRRGSSSSDDDDTDAAVTGQSQAGAAIKSSGAVLRRPHHCSAGRGVMLQGTLHSVVGVG